MVHWTGGFTGSKGGNGISQIGDRTNERLGGMWMGHVLQWVWLQESGTFKMARE